MSRDMTDADWDAVARILYAARERRLAREAEQREHERQVQPDPVERQPKAAS